MAAPAQGKNGVGGTFEFRGDSGVEHVVQRAGKARIAFEDGEVGFRHQHFDVVQHRGEEWPVVGHRSNGVVAVDGDSVGEGGTDAVPAGEA